MTAINLLGGDVIEAMYGMACITKLVRERNEEPVPVYSFHVKDWASYFVGEVRVYVHNGRKHQKVFGNHLMIYYQIYKRGKRNI